MKQNNKFDFTSLKSIMKEYGRLQQAANNNYKAEEAFDVQLPRVKEFYLNQFIHADWFERVCRLLTDEEKQEVKREIEDCLYFMHNPEEVVNWEFYNPEDNDFDDFFHGYVQKFVEEHYQTLFKAELNVSTETVEYARKEYSVFDLLTEREKTEYSEIIEALREECLQKEKEIEKKRAEAQKILQDFDLMEVVRRNTFINKIEPLGSDGQKNYFLIYDHEGRSKKVGFRPSKKGNICDSVEKCLNLLAVQKDPWSLKDC